MSEADKFVERHYYQFVHGVTKPDFPWWRFDDGSIVVMNYDGGIRALPGSYSYTKSVLYRRAKYRHLLKKCPFIKWRFFHFILSGACIIDDGLTSPPYPPC